MGWGGRINGEKEASHQRSGVAKPSEISPLPCLQSPTSPLGPPIPPWLPRVLRRKSLCTAHPLCDPSGPAVGGHGQAGTVNHERISRASHGRSVFHQHLSNEEINWVTSCPNLPLQLLFAPVPASLDPCSDPVLPETHLSSVQCPHLPGEVTKGLGDIRVTNPGGPAQPQSSCVALGNRALPLCISAFFFSSQKETVCKRRQRNLINYLINSLAETQGSVQGRARGGERVLQLQPPSEGSCQQGLLHRE